MFATGPSVETLRNQRQAVVTVQCGWVSHGTLWRFPKKPTSGRGGPVITAALGTSTTGPSVESLRNQRQAVEDRS